MLKFVQESALRSRHITIVKKGWLSKGPDSNQDASIVSFRVGHNYCDLSNCCTTWLIKQESYFRSVKVSKGCVWEWIAWERWDVRTGRYVVFLIDS